MVGEPASLWWMLLATSVGRWSFFSCRLPLSSVSTEDFYYIAPAYTELCTSFTLLPAPPLPSPPLTASPCERTPAPCPQCSVQQRRWSPSEPPPLAPQSHSGLVRRSPWQRWHWREERWDGRKRGRDSRLDNLATVCVYHVSMALPRVKYT